MDVKIGDNIQVIAYTRNASGVLQDADSGPTYAVHANGTAVLTGQTMTDRGTGTYYDLCAITVGNGFAVGDLIDVIGTATVDSVADSGPLFSGKVVAATVDQIASQTDKLQFDGDNFVQANAEKISGYGPKGNIDNGNQQITLWGIPSDGNSTFAPFEEGAEVTLADSEDVYPADIQLTVDDTNSKDEFTIQWFRNGTPVSSGITVPTIQAIKRADGTDLIAVSAMTQIGSTGAYKYDAITTERTTAGEAVVIVASATINGSTRTWRKVITRDVVEVPA